MDTQREGLRPLSAETLRERDGFLSRSAEARICRYFAGAGSEA